MGTEQLDYYAILADWEAKRAALDAAIASLKVAIAAGILGSPGDGTALAASGIPSMLMPSASGSEVPAGAFLGKSIPDAAKLYLAIVKKKQTSREIAEALKRGGMESTSKNFYGNVHSILDRARKANTGIVKLDRSYWGLAEWYPAGLRNTTTLEKRGGRKKPSPKKKASPALLAAAKASEAAKSGGQEAILKVLTELRGNHYTPSEIGIKVGYSPNIAAMLLARLAKAGKVARALDGRYYAQLLTLAG